MSLNTVTEEELSAARTCRAEAWAVMAGIPGHSEVQFVEWWEMKPMEALEPGLDVLAHRIATGCGKCSGCVEPGQPKGGASK